MSATLVVVPCGQSKIWDRYPEAGTVAARDAYIGAPFRVNRDFAEKFGDRWTILSANHGFISPDFVIPGPYEVTFERTRTNPIPVVTLFAGGEVDGPKLRGKFRPGGADVVTMRRDGVGVLDIRGTIEAHDGAVIYMVGSGLAYTSEDAYERAMKRDLPPTIPLRAALAGTPGQVLLSRRFNARPKPQGDGST